MGTHSSADTSPVQCSLVYAENCLKLDGFCAKIAQSQSAFFRNGGSSTSTILKILYFRHGQSEARRPHSALQLIFAAL